MSEALAFISHSSADKRFATELAKRLRVHDVDVWIDHEQINFGDSIPGKISTGLATCDVILVLVSQAFIRSSWCKAEYEPLLVREVETERTLAIPVRLDDASIPPLLAAKRYVDLRHGLDDATIQVLAETIREMRSYKHVRRLVSEPPPTFECSLLAMVLSSVLKEVPVSVLATSDLLSGRRLVDLYRAVDLLVRKYAELCDEILRVLADSSIEESLYGSANRISSTKLETSNRRLLEIAREMRDIAQSLNGILKKDQPVFSRLTGIAELCTLISVAEDFLILKLGAPSAVPASEAWPRYRSPLGEIPGLPVYDNVNAMRFDGDLGRQMVSDFNRILAELNAYRADLRAGIASLVSDGA